MENWKDIRGFEGYQVSDKGRVRTHKKVTSNKRYTHREWQDRILRQKVSKADGRARVCIWANNEEHTFLVHRLMAYAFLGDPEAPGMTVNHIDGNPLNNVVENIEWVTRAENIRLAFENGQYHSIKPISIIATNGEIYRFKSYADCDRFLKRKIGYTSRMVGCGKDLMDNDGMKYSRARI